MTNGTAPDKNGDVYIKRSAIEKVVLGAFGMLLLTLVGAATRELVALHNAAIVTNQKMVESNDRMMELASKVNENVVAIKDVSTRQWELQLQVSKGQANSDSQRKEIVDKLQGMKETVQDKIPDKR